MGDQEAEKKIKILGRRFRPEQEVRMRIGAHASIKGGIWRAVERTKAMGGNTFQIFSGSPRSWQRPDISGEDVSKFRDLAEKYDVLPAFIHAKYLVSLGNGDSEIQQKSIRSLVDDLALAERIGAEGVIFHPQGKEFDLLIENMKKVLNKSPEPTRLIVENTAQNSMKEMGEIFKKVDSGRLRFCFDTAHAYEAGYEMRKEEEMEDLLELIEEQIGLERFVVIHVNDSKTSLGSRNDKHEDIGEGEMGENPFSFLLNDPRTKHLPFILETPGFKGKGGVSEEGNMERLRRMAGRR